MTQPSDPAARALELGANLTSRVDQLESRLELNERTIILVAFACLVMAVGGILRPRRDA